MPNLAFSFNDTNGINRFLTKLPKMLNEKLEHNLRLRAAKTREQIVRNMAFTPKTGNLYQRKSGRLHIASSPGNPPAIDTGKLAGSINYNVVGTRVTFKADANYAEYVEKGTHNRDKTVRMSPRPFFYDVLNKEFSENNITKQIRDVVRNILG